jgi:flagellar biosynthesis regulator FlaF
MLVMLLVLLVLQDPQESKVQLEQELMALLVLLALLVLQDLQEFKVPREQVFRELLVPPVFKVPRVL